MMNIDDKNDDISGSAASDLVRSTMSLWCVTADNLSILTCMS